MQELQYIKPLKLDEALEFLDMHGKEAKILAGGTDIIIALKDRMVRCKYLVDIKAIKELQNITYSDKDGLSIGAAVSLNDIINSNDINDKYKILVDAAKTLANSLLRNRATLAGNICNASPGGDMLPASLVLDGEVHIASRHGIRVIPLKDFFLGVKRNALMENEVVTKIVFPKSLGTGKYLKKSRIKGHDLAQISVAAFLREDGNMKISIGAAGPTPILIEGLKCYKKEELLNSKNEIVDMVISKINPISDQRATKEYRMAMAKYLTNQILEELCGGV